MLEPIYCKKIAVTCNECWVSFTMNCDVESVSILKDKKCEKCKCWLINVKLREPKEKKKEKDPKDKKEVEETKDKSKDKLAQLPQLHY